MDIQDPERAAKRAHRAQRQQEQQPRAEDQHPDLPAPVFKADSNSESEEVVEVPRKARSGMPQEGKLVPRNAGRFAPKVLHINWQTA